MLAKVIIFLATISAVHATTDCSNADNFRFFYANTGGSFSNAILSVNIACLGPGQCDIIYSSGNCKGCFTPCDRRIFFNNVSEGEIVTVDITTAGFALVDGVKDGDLICSTNQVAASGRESTTNLNEVAEWSGNWMAGTQFMYTTSRANLAECTVFTFDADTEVTMTATSASPNEGPLTLDAWSSTRFPVAASSVNAQNDEVIFTSDHPILLSCFEGGNDFTNVPPVTNAPIYGKNSQNTRIAVASCADLSPITGTSSLSCANSDNTAVTVSTSSGNVFSIGNSQGSRFSGPGLVCEPTAATSCMSAFAVGDGDGSEGVSWFSAQHFADYYVSPFTCDQITIVSNVNTTCTVGSTIMEVEAVSSAPGVFEFYDTATSPVFPSGSTITCDDPVMIIASHGDDEFNLHGRVDESLITFFPQTTCAPTASPTTRIPSASPSDSPTRSPTTSPTLSPTTSPTQSPTLGPTIDAALVGGVSGGAVALCAAFFFAFGAFRRYQRELAKDEMMLNPDVYLDEGFGESRDGKGVAEVTGTESGKHGFRAIVSATVSRTLARKKDKTAAEIVDVEKEKDATNNKLEKAKEQKSQKIKKVEKTEEELQKEQEEKQALLTFANDRRNGSEFEHDLGNML